jgi:hypothetical protein
MGLLVWLLWEVASREQSRVGRSMAESPRPQRGTDVPFRAS